MLASSAEPMKTFACKGCSPMPPLHFSRLQTRMIGNAASVSLLLVEMSPTPTSTPPKTAYQMRELSQNKPVASISQITAQAHPLRTWRLMGP